MIALQDQYRRNLINGPDGLFLLYLLEWAACSILLYLFGETAAAVLITLACVLALGGETNIFRALTISWFVVVYNFGYNYDNPKPPGQLYEQLRWLILILTFGNFYIRRVTKLSPKFQAPRERKWLLVLVACMVLLSAISSYALDVSLFKICVFAMGSLLILDLTSSPEGTAQFTAMRLWMGAMVWIVVVHTALIIPTAFAYVTNNQGLQGILNQPQSLGVFLVPATIYCLGLRDFLRNKILQRLTLVVACLAGLEMLLSLARTAILAFVITGVFFAFWSFYRGRIRTLVFFMCILTGGIASMSVPTIQSYALSILYKRTDASERMSDVFYSSRGFVLNRSFDNIALNPLTGIGFGLPSYPEQLVVTRDPLIGLPVSAPAEKGNGPIGMVEENGFLIILPALLLLVSIVSSRMKYRSPIPALLAVGILTTNLGEATFFSVGGMGLALWLLLGLSGRWKMRSESLSPHAYTPYGTTLGDRPGTRLMHLQQAYRWR